MSMSDNPQISAKQVDDLLFKPSDAQIRAKSAFWSRFYDNPICDPQSLTLTVASQFVGDSRIERWWSTPGFREWFSNTNEFRERLEMLAYKSLTRLEQIIDSPTTNPNAQVNAIKLLMEMGRKLPRLQQDTEKYADEKIAKMSKAELEEYIRRNIKLVPQAGNT